jgi:adenylate cyclase
MAQEIERQFLVKGTDWRRQGGKTLFRQGYLARSSSHAVRVRLAGDRAWLTIKGPTHGLRRLELEYAIPTAEAVEMLDTLCVGAIIEKHRYHIAHAGLIWEVDEFHGLNEGLVIAEVELQHEEQEIDLPEWVGEEVSFDPRYYNANLIDHPYSTW